MASLEGKLVQVVRGRKVTVGTVCRCLWHGRTRFGMRVLLKFDDGGGATSSTFTRARNVRALEGQPHQRGLFEEDHREPEDPGDILF